MFFKKILFIFLLACALSLTISTVFAANEPEVVKLDNPFGAGRTDFRLIIGEIIAGVMGVVGALTLAVFVVGGFMWITAGGSSEKVSKGTQAMLWAVIGLFIIFGSYAILSLVLKGVTGQ